MAYCAQPNETVDLILTSGAAILVGTVKNNWPLTRKTAAVDLKEGSLCDRLSAGWYRFANGQLRTDLRRWMKTLPDIIIFTHQGLSAAVIHDGVSDIACFLWLNSPQSEFLTEIKLLRHYVVDVDLVDAGHYGFAFTRQIGPVIWINAGAIGMSEH